MEPIFGQSKQTQGADRFMMRGEQAARGEEPALQHSQPPEVEQEDEFWRVEADTQ